MPRSKPAGGSSPTIACISSSAASAAASSPESSARFSRCTGAGELGALLERAAEVHVDVRRRRPVHPGDLHVAAERDHADAVLDPVARRLRRAAGGKPR